MQKNIHSSLQPTYRSKIRDLQEFTTLKTNVIDSNLEGEFGQHSVPIVQLLLRYSNSLQHNPSAVIDNINKRNEMDEEFVRKLVPLTPSRTNINKAIMQLKEELYLRKKNCINIDELKSIKDHLFVLELAETHPMELVFIKVLNKYCLIVHTHNGNLKNGFNSKLEIGPFSISGDWESEYGILIPLPDGMFEFTIFNRLDNMLYTESKIRSTLDSNTIRHVRPLSFYNNWLLQCNYKKISNGSLFYDCLNTSIIQKENLIDYIKSSITKVE